MGTQAGADLTKAGKGLHPTGNNQLKRSLYDLIGPKIPSLQVGKSYQTLRMLQDERTYVRTYSFSFMTIVIQSKVIWTLQKCLRIGFIMTI